MTVITQIFSSPYVLAFVALISAYVISIRIYPAIIYLSHSKDLMDEPCERSMHQGKTPTLGGIGLFLTFAIGMVLIGVFAPLPPQDVINVLALVGATMLLLFLGVKDDLVLVSPKKKFSGQLIAAALVVFASDIRIVSMEGIFGFGELPYWVSVVFTVFVFLLVINAFNLIDGIDGLAGGLAILSATVFGLFFFVNGQLYLALASVILIGALIGFLQHNLSKRQKLFMGDSGSLFTGFLLAYLTIAFLNKSADATAFALPIANAPILAIAVLSYPMMDTLRVFTIRIRAGRSPFSADKNHIHHRFLSLGFSHKKSSMCIVGLNLAVVLVALALQDINIHLQLFACLVVGVSLYLSPFYVKGKKTEVRLGKVVQNYTGIKDDESIKSRNAKAPEVFDEEIARLIKVQQEAVRMAKRESFFGKRLRAGGTSIKGKESAEGEQYQNKL
ncbi:MraY family glycosyltransferase [Maribacter chungangensis]|uniref:MraY family glycosyltransferase n=1 Tax=Maribacter chungangensis TaxID=1069117 RepID=A0ABW3B516_9FLAO